MSKRCEHDWLPLVTATPPKEPGARLRFGFALALSHIDRYDRCTKCGRISYLANSRRAPRRMLSCDTSRLVQQAQEFDEWAKKDAVAKDPNPGALET